MFMALWVGLLVVAAVAAVAWAVQQRGTRDDEAFAILDRRLAAGELSVEEHAQRREVLLERDRRRTMPWWWLVLVLVLVGLVVLALVSSMWMGGFGWGPRGGDWMGRHMGWDGSSGSSAASIEGARTIDVAAGDLWFEPDTIEVTAGQPVNVVLANTGAVFHDLTVPAANFVLAADPGERATGGLELRDSGRVEFFCSVPGHAEAGMRGTVVVSASTDS